MTGRPALLPGARSDPEKVLRHLELSINRRLTGLLQGDYRGLVAGAGTELDDGRLYEPGDDVRRIDWPLTARSGTVHVRNTVADRELETWVVVDGSASMEFGTADNLKRDIALAAAGAVGFLTARSGNRIGALLLGPGRPQIVPPRAGRDGLMALLHLIARRPPAPDGTGVILADGIKRAARATRRGLVVVISDFLCASPWPQALRALASRTSVLAIEVIDPRELELPAVGYLTLVDPETGRLREVQTANADLRARYKAAAAEQRKATARQIRHAGCSHLVLRTDRDWLLDVATFVTASRRTAAHGRP